VKPTQEEVQRLFSYSAIEGVLTRRTTVSSNAKIGDVVGWTNGDGYLCVRVNKTIYKVHQIVWLHVIGSWATGVIDHINRDKTDNRISNLRDTTVQVNNINKGVRKDSKTGVPNVTWRERDKRYYVACRRDGKQNYVGSFKTLELAEAMALKFVEEIGKAMK